MTKFPKLVSKYCNWVESLDSHTTFDLNDLLILLSDLLKEALLMPVPTGFTSETDLKQFSQREWKKIHEKFSSLPFQYYREVFDPHDFEDDESVTGDLHEDLADIYCDLKRSLLIYHKGFEDQAIFEWKWSFNYHWGEHILSALRALFMFIRNKKD
jgi:hypothetical protein